MTIAHALQSSTYLIANCLDENQRSSDSSPPLLFEGFGTGKIAIERKSRRFQSIAIMIRWGPCLFARSTLRSFSIAKRGTPSFAFSTAQRTTSSSILSSQHATRGALAVHRPITRTLQRHATTNSSSPSKHTDLGSQQDLAHQKLEAHPEEVSEVSTVHQVFHEKGVEDEKKPEEEEEDEPMLKEVYSDWVRIPKLEILSITFTKLSILHRKSSKKPLRFMKSLAKLSSLDWLGYFLMWQPRFQRYT